MGKSTPLKIAPQPQVRSYVRLYEGAVWSSYNPKPNRWWRMWQWLLLGWKWEDVSPTQP